MTTIVTRTGKGSPLTNTEMDTNLTNLNSFKLETTNNLSDLSNKPTARVNLGVETRTTGSTKLASGTTAERDGYPSVGYIRYNSTLDKIEGYLGSGWCDLGSGLPTQTGNAGTVITTNGSTVFWGSSIKSGTAVVLTNATAIDFTGIPSWVNRITIILNGVSTTGASNLLVQFGSTSVETTGYLSQSNTFNATPASAVSTAGFLITAGNNSSATHNIVATGYNISGNTWIFAGNGAAVLAADGVSLFGGSKTLASTLERLRITTVNGTNALDAGTINIMWE